MATTGTLHTVPPTVLPPRQFRVVLTGLMTVMVLAVMDTNIVNTSLPRITSDLGGLSRLSWVVSAFLLTSTIAAPLYGKFSDMYGRRRLLVISIGIFLIGSVLCGLSRSMLQLILFRALQGLGAGGLIVLVQTVVSDLVLPRDRGRYQGLFTSVFGMSSLAGPLLGGALTTYFSWHWIFYVNLPVGALALTLIMSSLPAKAALHRHSIDYGGAALLIVATTAFLSICSLGLASGWAAADAVLAVVTVVGFYAFRRQEKRAPEPILNLKLFDNRIFVAGVGITGTMAFALFAEIVLLPLYLQIVLGETPVQASFVIVPQVVGMIISSYFGGRAVSRTGRIKPFLMAAVVIQAIALWCFVLAVALASSVWPFTIIAFLLGFGMGSGMPNTITIVQSAVRREEIGAATGSLVFIRSLGGTVGVALTGGVLNLVMRWDRPPGPAGALPRNVAQIGEQAVHAIGAGRAAGYVHAIDVSFMLSAVLMCGCAIFVAWLPRETPDAGSTKAKRARTAAEPSAGSAGSTTAA